MQFHHSTYQNQEPTFIVTNQLQVIETVEAIAQMDKTKQLNALKQLKWNLDQQPTNLLILSQPLKKDGGEIAALDTFIDTLFECFDNQLFRELLIDYIFKLIAVGAFSSRTIGCIIKPLGEDHMIGEVSIPKLRAVLSIFLQMFPNQGMRGLDQPNGFFYFPNTNSQLRLHQTNSPWPFNKALIIVTWVQLLPSEQDRRCNIFQLVVGNTYGIDIYTKENNLYYSTMNQKKLIEEEKVAYLPYQRWIYLRFELKPASSQKYTLQIHMNDMALDPVKLSFPTLQGEFQFTITFGRNFNGYISTIMIFKEFISFDTYSLRFGIQQESHLRNVYKMLEHNFQKIYLLYTPLRVGEFCYDVIGQNHAEMIDDANVYINQRQLRKWRNIMSIQVLLPFLHYLKYVDPNIYPEYLNEILSLLINILTMRTESQSEVRNIDFFALVAQFIIEGPPSFFNEESIHLLAQLYKCLSDRVAKEKIFSDLLWQLTRIKFTSENLLEEYFQLIRVIYNQNPINCCQQFTFSDMLNQLVELQNFGGDNDDQMTLPPLHLKLYFNLIESMCLVVRSDEQASRQSKQFNKSTILQLVKFLSNKYKPVFLIAVLNTLQNMIYYKDDGESRQTLQQAEQLFIILDLCIVTRSPHVKTSAINLIHKIVKGNSAQIDEFDICVYLSSIFKRPQVVVAQKRKSQLLEEGPQFGKISLIDSMEKTDTHMNFMPLYVALLNWSIHTHGRLTLPDTVMIDDSCQIKSKNAFTLVLRFFQNTDYQLKGKILQDIYTLIKFNNANRLLLINDDLFHRTIIESILELQIKLFTTSLTEFEIWIWGAGKKMYLQLLWHSMVNEQQGYKRVALMMVHLQILEEQKHSQFGGLACKFLLRSMIKNFIIVIKEHSQTSNILLKMQPHACENIQKFYILLLSLFICDPIESGMKNGNSLVLKKHYLLSFKLFLVESKESLPLNWTGQSDKWVDYKLFPYLLQLNKQLFDKFQLNTENADQIGQIFETPIEELKDLFQKIMWDFGLFEVKSQSVFFIRFQKYIFNLYADYILFNDRNGSKIKDLQDILQDQNSKTCLLILLFEILKFKSTIGKTIADDVEMKIYNFTLEHLNFLYCCRRQVQEIQKNQDLLDEYEINTDESIELTQEEDFTKQAQEYEKQTKETREQQSKIVNNAIFSFLTYVLNITKYIKDNIPKIDIAAKLNSPQFLSFRIIGKLLKCDKTEVPSNLSSQQFYESLWDEKIKEQTFLNPNVINFILSSQQMLKKIETAKFKYDDIVGFKETEIVEKKKQIIKAYQTTQYNFDQRKTFLREQIQPISLQVMKDFELNQLYREQDQQLIIRLAKTQQRRSWNYLFSQVGPWNSAKPSTSLPPTNFTFSMSKYLTKSLVRPLLKVKRIFSDFDGIPVLKEKPYKSFIDHEEVDSSGSQSELGSPVSRKKHQLQWDNSENTKEDQDWKENLVNILRDLHQQQQITSKDKHSISIPSVQWIKTLTIRNGTLEIHENKISFIQYPSNQVPLFFRHEFPTSRSLVKEWAIQSIVAINKRRYLARKNCIQIILEDGQTLIFNFRIAPDEIINQVIQQKMLEKTKQTLMMQMIVINDGNFDLLLEKQRKMDKWMNGKMSNLKYLLYLNNLASRSFKDLSQYPVLPWILKKYHGDKIDLNNKEFFRDLSKPMGACGSPERSLSFHEKFYNTDLHQEGVPPFHYGSHYSNPGIVMHFLIRLQPFSRGARELQSGRWDIPDRLFHSVKEIYYNATHEMSDVRELVPEMYYLPEMFLNLMGHEFGYMQTGEHVDNVVMPTWSGLQGAYGFVSIHRQALEGNMVSASLNEWIDLIFGYKQRGKPAEENLNTFYFLTYDDSIQLDTIQDQSLKRSLESQILHFGQTPFQLFTKPHPKKTILAQSSIIDKETVKLTVNLEYKEQKHEIGAFQSFISLFQKEEIVQSSSEKIKKQKIIHIALCSQQKVLVVRKNGEITIIRFLNPQNKNIIHMETERTINFDFYKTKEENILKFNPDDMYNQQRLIYLQRSQILMLGGIWDGRLEVFSEEQEVRTSVYYNHVGRINSISNDKKENYVATGCIYGQVSLWKFDSKKKSLRLIQAYQDHVEQVNDINFSDELKIFATCGTDGRINFYNIHNQKYLRSFFHDSPIDKVYQVIQISRLFFAIVLFILSFIIVKAKVNFTPRAQMGNHQLPTLYNIPSQPHYTLRKIMISMKLWQQKYEKILQYFMNKQQEIIFLSTPFLQEINFIKLNSSEAIAASIDLTFDKKIMLIGTRDGNLTALADSSVYQKMNE